MIWLGVIKEKSITTKKSTINTATDVTKIVKEEMILIVKIFAMQCLNADYNIKKFVFAIRIRMEKCTCDTTVKKSIFLGRFI